MPAIISDILDHLKNEISKDTFNLTRDDQDTSYVKIDELKEFMRALYGRHKKAV